MNDITSSRSQSRTPLVFLRSVISGGIAGLVQLGTFYVLVTKVSVWYIAATVVAYGVAFVVNFSLQKWFSFREHSSSEIPRQVLSFAALALCNALASVGGMYVLVQYLHLAYLPAQVVVICALSVINFFVGWRFIFVSRGSSRSTVRFGWTALVVCIGLVAWIGLHVPGVLYGTAHIPLHQSYVGDEQSPVNGALHMLESKDPFDFGTGGVFYYGPVFAVIAVPAIVADYAVKRAEHLVTSSDEYRDYILWDWGGIIIGIRIIAVLFSLLALYAFWKTLELAQTRRTYAPLIGAALLATDFYFFEYSSFFKHWAIIIPCLLVQLATLVILDREPARRWPWVVHALAALAAFGVSYISALGMVMWLPYLYKHWRAGDTAFLRRFFVLCAILLVGALGIILWYPYAFVRMLGFIGVGAPTGGLNGAQDPFMLGAGSWAYYLRLVVENHLSFFVAGVALAAVMGKKAVRDHLFIASLLVAGIFFLLFAPAAHHEGRYMLPTIVFLLLALGRLVSLYLEGNERRWKILIIIMLLCGAAYMTINDLRVAQLFSEGPRERTVLPTLLAGKQPILFINTYIYGWPHTESSYEAYAVATGKTGVNLYQAMLAAPPPVGVPLLDARYATESSIDKDPALLAAYPTIVEEYNPRPADLNQFDYIDEDLARLWYAEELLPMYIVVHDPAARADSH